MNNYRKEQFRKKYSKKARMRIACCVVVFFLMTFISLRSIAVAMMNNAATKKVLKEKEIELIQAKERHKVLEHDLKKLEDPEYISQYIRDDYYVVGDDEVFFVLPEEEVEDESTQHNN